MADDSVSELLDYGLVAPISIPKEDGVPEEVDGVTRPLEYEEYFRLQRASIDLVEWTRTCIKVNYELIKDLDESSISESDKRDMLVGIIRVQNTTLLRWLAVAVGQEKGI
ncbi:hypothetical protein [Mycobacterium sp. 852002-40037_SCH5390672]|uniref:hypothetical protein n=1 Tax=Mycobacterium sp. 852002-40037_SCH5390672 TaxID=1834089 RepID=UPI000AD4F5E4|nr:hypothetical protein [Mycobacterium sp. 852002-40037_SCH5390672]